MRTRTSTVSLNLNFNRLNDNQMFFEGQIRPTPLI